MQIITFPEIKKKKFLIVSYSQVWIFCCIGFVGLSLVEYAVLLLHLRSSSFAQQQRGGGRGNGGGGGGGIGGGIDGGKLFVSEGKNSARQRARLTKMTAAASTASTASTTKDFYKRVDTAAIVVFAVAFAVFNAVYWHKYWV